MVDGIENEVDQKDFVTSGALDWQHVVESQEVV